MTFYLFFAFLILQRLSELWLSRRNEKWLRSQGAVEFGRSHYPFIIALHIAFFVSLMVEVEGFHRTPAAWWWIPIAAFLLAQVLRYWSISTLGRRWNTRVLVLPHISPIQSGPYRFLHHPNYLAIVIELLSIPLVFQAYFTAVAFTTLNAAMLGIRIPAENRALKQS